MVTHCRKYNFQKKSLSKIEIRITKDIFETIPKDIIEEMKQNFPETILDSLPDTEGNCDTEELRRIAYMWDFLKYDGSSQTWEFIENN